MNSDLNYFLQHSHSSKVKKVVCPLTRYHPTCSRNSNLRIKFYQSWNNLVVNGCYGAHYLVCFSLVFSFLKFLLFFTNILVDSLWTNLQRKIKIVFNKHESADWHVAKLLTGSHSGFYCTSIGDLTRPWKSQSNFSYSPNEPEDGWLYRRLCEVDIEGRFSTIFTTAHVLLMFSFEIKV